MFSFSFALSSLLFVCIIDVRAAIVTESDILKKLTAVQLKVLCKERGLKVSGKKADLILRLEEHFFFVGAALPVSSQNVSVAMDSQAVKVSGM
jgi:hypothetical protein